MTEFHPTFSFIFLSILSIFSLSGCEVDHGLRPSDPTEILRHGIKGSIIFKGTWPENVAEARLVVSEDFPPDPSASADDFIFSDPIEIGADTLSYGLSLQPGTYKIIAVIFREENQGWDIANILSVYSQFSGVLGFLFPDSVMIDSDSTIVGGVDLSVDFTLGSISGTVSFVGEWPDPAPVTGLAVFERQPQLNNPLALLSVRGVTILPAGVSTTSYRVRVPPGRYEAVNVLAILSLSPLNIKLLGRYEPGASQPIQVSSREDVPGTDITAYLNLIQ